MCLGAQEAGVRRRSQGARGFPPHQALGCKCQEHRRRLRTPRNVLHTHQCKRMMSRWVMGRASKVMVKEQAVAEETCIGPCEAFWSQGAIGKGRFQLTKMTSGGTSVAWARMQTETFISHGGTSDAGNERSTWSAGEP